MAPLTAAFDSLRENVRLALISALGVAIASMAIVLLASIGIGVEKDMTRQIDDLGVGLLITVPGKVGMGTFNPNLAGKSYLSDEAEAEVAKVDGVMRTAKFSFAGGGIKSGSTEAFPIIIATTPSWFEMQSADLAAGTFFDQGSADRPVCVLGTVAQTDLFGTGSAVGHQVDINGTSYEVVGVVRNSASEDSPFSMFGFSNVAYIPLDYVRSREPNSQIDRIIVQVAKDREPKALVKNVSAALGKHLTDQQFSVLTQEDLLNLVNQIVGILSALVAGLTSIALLVGGLGIMAVMLLNVGGRTVEIGVRKAVGATRRQVFFQFLFESALTGMTGVGIGILVAVVLCGGIAALTPIKPLVTLGTIGLALGFGLVMGCVFGSVPALKAAKLDPVEALRRY